jgi:hypothetical protein
LRESSDGAIKTSDTTSYTASGHAQSSSTAAAAAVDESNAMATNNVYSSNSKELRQQH